MTLYHSKYARGSRRVPVPLDAGAVVGQRFEYDVTGNEVLNDIVEMAPLPAGLTVVDAILDCDDLDEATSLAFDVGVMSGKFGESLDDDGQARTCGAEILDGVITGQAGGVVRPTLATAFRIASADYDRGIGLKWAAAAGTPAAGKVGLTLIYGPAES